MNTLPDLPRVIKKKEQDITPKILQWFRDNYHDSFALEIKISNTDTLPPSKIQPHQIRALLLAETSFVHKIKDSGRVQNPFDAFGLYKVKSWIVIYFTKHRRFVALRPQTFLTTKQIRFDTPSELPIGERQSPSHS